MKSARILAAALGFFLLACQATAIPTVTIIENNQIFRLQTTERDLLTLLDQARITLNPNDRILLNGLPTALNQPITDYPITLQVRRAGNVEITTGDGIKKFQSSA